MNAPIELQICNRVHSSRIQDKPIRQALDNLAPPRDVTGYEKTTRIKRASNGSDATHAWPVWQELPALIDGATLLLAIVGDPVMHARSPVVVNALLAKAGQNAVLVPWHAPTDDFETVMQGLLRTRNLVGLVMTYPFKQRALTFVDNVSPAAHQIGAVNAMRRETDGRWTGDMFDGLGLVRAVGGLGRSVTGSAVKLIGAGGAGGAIAHALADAGAATVSIYDVDAQRAEALAAAVKSHAPGCRATSGDAALGDVQILINATPVGMLADDGLPGDMTGLHAGITVVDIVPRHCGTPLLTLARDRGCPHVGGAAMVEGQAALLLDFFGLSAGSSEEIRA